MEYITFLLYYMTQNAFKLLLLSKCSIRYQIDKGMVSRKKVYSKPYLGPVSEKNLKVLR